MRDSVNDRLLHELLQPALDCLDRAMAEAIDPAVAQLPPGQTRDRVTKSVRQLKRNIRQLPRSLAKHHIRTDDEFRDALLAEVGRLVASSAEIVALCKCEGRRWEH